MTPGSGSLVWLCIILQISTAINRVTPSRTRERRIRTQGYTAEALERLSQVFGIDQVPSLTHHRSPPEYMLELYHSVAYSDGVSRKANPYDADVVRGFPDRASRHQTQYHFNVSLVDKSEGVLAAELRLYKMRPDQTPQMTGARRGAANIPHVIVLRLYQVLYDDWEHVPDSLILVDQRRISGYATGWQVFTVTDTIRSWLNDTQVNHGFLITASTLDGTSVNGTYVKFAQRREHHDSKQPVLVVFSGDMVARYVPSMARHNVSSVAFPVPHHDTLTNQADTSDDLASVRESYIHFLNEQYRSENGAAAEFPYERYRAYMSTTDHERLLEESYQARLVHDRQSASRTRPRRSTRQSRTSQTRRGMDYKSFRRTRHKACQRNELYVDFAEIGWSGWIISPKGYNAHHCWGDCPFPLGQYHRPTNHATVQSIVYTMRINKNVQLPCCVPDKLYSISLLYFDDEENVILKQYDEMVAASCGCH